MNAAENIVEAYFRYCLGCFTMTDVKVERGNNRQLDLIAIDLRRDEAYHVETSVKIAGFGPTLPQLEMAFERKFFGAPRANEKPEGDHALGKNYRPAIDRTYRRLGLKRSRLSRVYVCWTVTGVQHGELDAFCERVSRRCHLRRNPIQVWSFRDRVLPELSDAVGTANYDHEALRTLSLLAAAERQRARRQSVVLNGDAR